MTPAPVLASLADTVESFLAGADDFFSHLATLDWFALIVGVGCFGLYLLLRSRALFNALRAAYPDEEVRWRDVWGGYVVAYGLNNFVPASAGNVAQYYLTDGVVPQPIGSAHQSVVPYQAFPTADGHIVIANLGESFWPNADPPGKVELTPEGRINFRKLYSVAAHYLKTGEIQRNEKVLGGHEPAILAARDGSLGHDDHDPQTRLSAQRGSERIGSVRRPQVLILDVYKGTGAL